MSTITPELIRGLVGESDDFAFEMRILRTLRECAGHSLPSRVLHGGMYSDPIRGEPRQYDFSFEIGRGALAVRLAIECKNVFKLWDDWFPDEALEAGFRSGFRAVDW